MDPAVEKSLRRAVENGHLRKVEKWVKRRGLSGCPGSSQGYDLLCKAIQLRHHNIAKFLLQKGAKVYCQDKLRVTPLHNAARDAKVPLEIVEMLVNSSAPIDVQDWLECTPLHYAAEMGNEGVVQMLLSRGAIPSSVDYEGSTPLHFAAGNGHLNVVKVLIDAGASGDATDSNGQTPLHRAAERGNEEVGQYLLSRGASHSLVNNCGWTPLHLAAREKRGKLVEVLIENGASVHVTDHNGWTPLHWAARHFCDSNVEVLLNNHANVHAIDISGNAPLNVTGSVDVVKVLLKFNANVNMQGKFNRSALHSAAGWGIIKLVDFLLNHGIDATLKDERGQTALELAVSVQSERPQARRYIEVVNALKKHIIQLNLVKLPVAERDMQLVHQTYDEEFKTFQGNCEQEVVEMKRKMLSCHSSVYHVFSNQLNHQFAGNEKLIEELTSCSVEQFPLYHTLLHSLSRRMKARLELLFAGRNSLKLILSISNDKKLSLISYPLSQIPVLPSEILDQIVLYLSSRDLQNLILCRNRLLGK